MDSIAQRIIKEIESRGLMPRPRWHFLLKRSLFWSLAIASVFVGGIAVAVTAYVFFDNDGMSFAQFRDTPLQDIVMGIPYVWLVALGLFTACAYYGFRRTRTGYRYATALVVAASILASVAIGIALNIFDVGVRVHQHLLLHTDFYDPLIHTRDDNDEERGRFERKKH